MAREAFAPLTVMLLLIATAAPAGATLWPEQQQCHDHDLFGAGRLLVCVGGSVCHVVGNGETFVLVCLEPAHCPKIDVALPPALCVPEDPDDDHDGWTVGQGDCDDQDPMTYPGAYEHPDGMDNDCNGEIDDGDADGDGWTVSQGDCDDMDPMTYPGAYEDPGDGRDNDCDGAVDEP